jgi:hypothetical protein
MQRYRKPARLLRSDADSTFVAATRTCEPKSQNGCDGRK